MASSRVNDYQNMLSRVNLVADGLGYPVDKDIKHTVVAFNLMGFHTSASCQGHFERALPYPWIDLDDADERKELDLLIKDFNYGRERVNNLLLKTVDFGTKGLYCRVMHYKDIADNGVKDAEVLALLQAEMNDFADYLLNIYNNSKLEDM